MPYNFETESPWIQASGGASVTPTTPSFTPGWMGVLLSGVANINGGTITDPTGWFRQTVVTIAGPAFVEIGLWTRWLQLGDVAPAMQWSGGGYNSAKMATFSGDVYTDQTTIKDVSGVSATTNTNSFRVPTITPVFDGDLVIYVALRAKTASTNGATIGTLSGTFGTFNKSPLADNVPAGGAQASTFQYLQQTTKASIPLGAVSYSITDSNLGTWGALVALKVLNPFVPSPPLSRGGMNVQVAS